MNCSSFLILSVEISVADLAGVKSYAWCKVLVMSAFSARATLAIRLVYYFAVA